jgi:hypothetical protein
VQLLKISSFVHYRLVNARLYVRFAQTQTGIAFAPMMIESEGRIVNINSIAGVLSGGLPAYGLNARFGAESGRIRYVGIARLLVNETSRPPWQCSE